MVIIVISGREDMFRAEGGTITLATVELFW
jgi:hypothetical protein